MRLEVQNPSRVTETIETSKEEIPLALLRWALWAFERNIQTGLQGVESRGRTESYVW